MENLSTRMLIILLNSNPETCIILGDVGKGEALALQSESLYAVRLS